MIFISFRDESAHSAGRLAHLLGAQFGHEEVFLADAVGGGTDLATATDTALQRCTAAVVVIGPTWTATAVGPVFRQVHTLLEREVEVLPVLVDGAAPPRADDLPEPVRALARLRALHLDHLTFRSDAEQVVDWLDSVIGGAPAGTRPPRRPSRVRRPPPPHRPVSWWQGLRRIALWWLVLLFALLTSMSAFRLLLGRVEQRLLVAAVVLLAIDLLLLGGCARALRREIERQRRSIDRAGPEAVSSGAGRAVSRGRVWLVTGAGLALAVLLGWVLVAP